MTPYKLHNRASQFYLENESGLNISQKNLQAWRVLFTDKEIVRRCAAYVRRLYKQEMRLASGAATTADEFQKLLDTSLIDITDCYLKPSRVTVDYTLEVSRLREMFGVFRHEMYWDFCMTMNNQFLSWYDPIYVPGKIYPLIAQECQEFKHVWEPHFTAWALTAPTEGE